MATHPSILVWRIPWTEEPGSYSPWGHTESDTTEATLTHMHKAVQIWRNDGYRRTGGPALNYVQVFNCGAWVGRVDIPTTHVVQGQL